ncbi:hypothetical protein DIZ27_23250 [Streptomyces sp. NWU339]|uniref:hypothetical protein n=1 Tax=Streptomyces sp. NWU339 TaxID=2185284 RepID=UPI000D67DE0B|nr:hypothetical protein [Streptomyces sp. NWU339]PWI08358.1 hypothetical protein DIZ27_23250 [Streptomyces sp. NWU339]
MTAQSYPGELEMLRGLARTLHVVVHDGGPAEQQRAEVRRLLHQYAGDDAAARAEEKSSPVGADATPAFFQPGRTYRSRRCADLRFECLALSADPDTGEQQAIGWRYGPPHNGVRRHKLAALGADDWTCCDWADTAERGESR